MTLDQLEMVEAVISEGSFQAAARKIHKSQPSLTTGIKKIEELYNIQLFSREAYRPVLTEVGKRFFESAKVTLSSYRQLQKLASEMGASYEPKLRLSIDPIVLSQRFIPILEVIQKENHHCELEIKSGVLFDNAQQVINGEADLAIGHLPSIDHELIESHKFCSIHLIPVIHKSILQDKELDKSILQKIPNIIVQTKIKNDSSMSSQSGIKWRVDSHNRKTELIQLGFGWGRLSSVQLEHYPELAVIPNDVVSDLKLDIFLMRSKEKPLGPIGRKVWASMKESINNS